MPSLMFLSNGLMTPSFYCFQTNFRPVWRRSGISDYYYYSIEDKTLALVAKDAQTAELSPNGKMVGL